MLGSGALFAQSGAGGRRIVQILVEIGVGQARLSEMCAAEARLGMCADGAGYLADLSIERRQRVQTSVLVGTPFWSMTSGWRFGFIRRWARTRFIPDDCGLKPPIDTLPQIAQERAMRGPLEVECGR